MYYLQSRYYDPEVCRFINADAFASTGQGVLGYNMFAYCNNNPTNCYDSAGTLPCQNTLRMSNDGGGYAYPMDIKYDVPLYDQEDYYLCWSFCQSMVEDYHEGKTRNSVSATFDAIARAIRANPFNWNKGNWPSNASKPDWSKMPALPRIEQIYDSLISGGPLYAYYSNGERGHLVVITGVDVNKGIVYTNNPHGYRGEQLYSEFVVCYAGGDTSNGMELYCLLYPEA